MPQTPASSLTSYTTAARLFDFIDWRIVGDCVRDDDSLERPTLNELTTPNNPAGLRVVAALEAASGELESACLPRGQYTADDLNALTGMGKGYLERVVAGLAVGVLFSRRWPASGKYEELPAVRYAEDTLERLRLGERVFGFAQNIDAGKGMSAPPFGPPPQSPTEDRNTVAEAYRFFGNRGFGQTPSRAGRE